MLMKIKEKDVWCGVEMAWHVAMVAYYSSLTACRSAMAKMAMLRDVARRPTPAMGGTVMTHWVAASPHFIHLAANCYEIAGEHLSTGCAVTLHITAKDVKKVKDA